MYAYGFRFYFTPLTAVLFAFPSRYWFAIGRSGVFSLGGWSPHVQTGFHVPRLTQFHPRCPLTYRAITFYGGPFQDPSARTSCAYGLFPVRSSLLGESRLISFPRGIEIFQFPRFASHPYRFRMGYPCGWVSPFGHYRVNVCCRLTGTFRRLPRPSSPLTAKASTVCA